ncbi:MAG: 5'-nucleotidase, lipoprotein e(P4) family [bacterium]
MITNRSIRKLWPCLICFIMGLGASSVIVKITSADHLIAQQKEPPFPMSWRLGSNLYMQTAAEYRACCLQIYQCAAMRLETMLQTNAHNYAKPAVVMDLDETVFDNSAFQSFLYRSKREYTESDWEVFERDFYDEVALVPGAKSFIENAESKGVTVRYISNRLEEHRQSTIKALAGLGINTKNIDGRLLLKSKGASSNKSSRRETVETGSNVLLYIGDNLRDFSETFAAPKFEPGDQGALLRAMQIRFARVDEAGCHWGVDWFVLPNPLYGEWEKLLGEQPMSELRTTRMNLSSK